MYFSSRRWTNQSCWKRSELRTPTLIRERPTRGEGHVDFLGESEGSLSPPHDSFPDAGEAINDFWSMSGNFKNRHHVEPRVKLYSPREDSFPIPLKYIDVSRTTHTNLDVTQESQSHPCTTKNLTGDGKEFEKVPRTVTEPGLYTQTTLWNLENPVQNYHGITERLWHLENRRDGVGEGGTRERAVCVYTCTPHQAHHTLPPVAIFPQARSFVCSFFPLSENACFQHVLCAAGGTSGDCYGRASCEFSARRDLLSAGSSHRVCDASSGGQHVAPALRIRSASTSARRRDTCTCEEVRGTFTSSDLGDTRAAVPCRVLNGSRHDRRKPGRHDMGNLTVLHYGC